MQNVHSKNTVGADVGELVGIVGANVKFTSVGALVVGSSVGAAVVGAVVTGQKHVKLVVVRLKHCVQFVGHGVHCVELNIAQNNKSPNELLLMSHGCE